MSFISLKNFKLSNGQNRSILFNNKQISFLKSIFSVLKDGMSDWKSISMLFSFGKIDFIFLFLCEIRELRKYEKTHEW